MTRRLRAISPSMPRTPSAIGWKPAAWSITAMCSAATGGNIGRRMRDQCADAQRHRPARGDDGHAGNPLRRGPGPQRRRRLRLRDGPAARQGRAPDLRVHPTGAGQTMRRPSRCWPRCSIRAYLHAYKMQGIELLVIEVNPRHVPYYRRMLDFKVCSDVRTNTHVHAPAVLMSLELRHAEHQIARFGGHPSMSIACAACIRCSSRPSGRQRCWRSCARNIDIPPEFEVPCPDVGRRADKQNHQTSTQGVISEASAWLKSGWIEEGRVPQVSLGASR